MTLAMLSLATISFLTGSPFTGLMFLSLAAGHFVVNSINDEDDDEDDDLAGDEQ